MVRSLNVVAVEAAMRVELGSVASMAERLGLPKPPPYPSIALGAYEATPMDIARAYTAFANDGMRVDPIAIHSTSGNGTEQSVRHAPKAGVLSPGTAYLVTDMLRDVVNSGTASCIRGMGYRSAAAGKTG